MLSFFFVLPSRKNTGYGQLFAVTLTPTRFNEYATGSATTKHNGCLLASSLDAAFVH
jgi:hypothetical protein